MNTRESSQSSACAPSSSKNCSWGIKSSTCKISESRVWKKTELVNEADTELWIYSVARTIALVPPEFTNEALASPDCLTAPTKSFGKQLRKILSQICESTELIPQVTHLQKDIIFNHIPCHFYRPTGQIWFKIQRLCLHNNQKQKKTTQFAGQKV